MACVAVPAENDASEPIDGVCLLAPNGDAHADLNASWSNGRGEPGGQAAVGGSDVAEYVGVVVQESCAVCAWIVHCWVSASVGDAVAQLWRACPRRVAVMGRVACEHTVRGRRRGRARGCAGIARVMLSGGLLGPVVGQ